MIDEYVTKNSHKYLWVCIFGTTFSILSALQYIDAVVGNSSSGLLEAPS